MDQNDNSNSYQSVAVICLAYVVISIWKQIDFLIYISIGLASISLIFKQFSDKVHFLWMKLALLLSHIFPPILLGIIFYLFLTPIAYISKLFNKNDSLMLKNTGSSTFVERNKTFETIDFKNPW